MKEIKIGYRFIVENFGTKLEYEIDGVDANGYFTSHLVKTYSANDVKPEQKTFLDDVEVPSDVADAPVEAVKESKPKTSTTTKRTYTKRTTTKK